MPRGPLWNEKEDAVVRRIYPQHGVMGVQAALPHRSLATIRQRASILGIRLIDRSVGRSTVPRAPQTASQAEAIQGERELSPVEQYRLNEARTPFADLWRRILYTPVVVEDEP